MEIITIKSNIAILQYSELLDDIKKLVDTAMEATESSYSPYSKFSVGTAVKLDNGIIVKGANQENAAFPVTMCAERAAIFNAQSNYPQHAITHIAIAAKNCAGFISDPISPCGSCRQALLEMEHRYGTNIKIYLYGKKCVYEINSIKDLLPLSFVDESMH